MALSDLLSISGSGLSAYQSQIGVYGENIANVNTEGYSRRSLELETGYTNDGLGTGVVSGDVTRVYNTTGRNALLQESPVAQYHAELAERYADLGSMINNGAEGLGELFSDFESALQDAIASPEDLSSRVVLLQKASTLTTEMNRIDSALANASASWDAPADVVANVNELTGRLQALNQEIYNAEAMGRSVPDLLDQRDELTLELAGTLNVSVAADYAISLDGRELVSADGGSRAELSIDDSNAFYLGGEDVSASVTSGKLAAVVVALETAEATGSQLDALASTLISDVNAVFETAYDLNGDQPAGTGVSFFTGGSASDVAVDPNLYDPANPLAANPRLVALAATANAGDNTAGQAIHDLLQASNAALDDQPIAEYWTWVETTLAGAANEESVLAESGAATVEMLDNQMDSVSGVNMDEELTHLMSAEKAYQACARVMSTASDLLDTLINLGR